MDFKLNCTSSWEELKVSSEPIVMYGTGNGADKVLDEMNRLNIPLYGVTASSGFVRKRFFRGFEVKPLEYFEENLDSFKIIITFGSSLKEVMDNIYALSKKHNTLVPVVPVIGDEIFNEEFFNKNYDKINKAYSLMADNESKRIFEGYVNFLYGGNLDTLKEITTEKSEAYKNILKLNENESFVDIGAYRGDTVEEFLSYTNGKYQNIICAEPDTKTFKKLLLNTENLSNIRCINCAVTDIEGDILFNDLHGRQSSLGGERRQKSESLESLCGNIPPTFVKIDAEGAEKLILEGGREVIREFKPKLKIATYHKSEDIFTLPLLIHEIREDYKIHLRHHPYIPAWDTDLYCV